MTAKVSQRLESLTYSSRSGGSSSSASSRGGIVQEVHKLCGGKGRRRGRRSFLGSWDRGSKTSSRMDSDQQRHKSKVLHVDF